MPQDASNKLVWRRTQPYTVAGIAFGGAPYWGHETLCWVGGGAHANCATVTFGGAPCGATKRCIGWGGRMRPAPLGPSVELPMGLRSAALGGRTACGLCH
eukprot:6878932-Pyramimonas_sp.AAC.3